MLPQMWSHVPFLYLILMLMYWWTQEPPILFISREFIERVGIEMRLTECSMVVSLPTSDSLIANRVYRGNKVTIASHEFEADLIVLDIHDFDIILGMDWLAKHRATVDCYRKEVQFSQPGEP